MASQDKEPDCGRRGVLREDGMVPAKWPMAQVTGIYPGKDGVIRVIDLKTPTGTYTRLVVKVAALIPTEQ